MNSFYEPIKSILIKLAEFLNIFDLSFFISGATLTSGIFFILKFKTPLIPQNIFDNINVIYAIIMSLACYISGLLCFAIGRKIHNGLSIKTRKIITEKLNYDIEKAIKDHGIEKVSYIYNYLLHDDKTLENSIYRLYPRLWAEIRQNTELKNSQTLLNRYWIMSATYDGVAVALFPWFLLLEVPIYNFITSFNLTTKFGFTFFPNAISYLICFLLFIITSKICIEEARRYKKYQVEELIATIAYFEQNKSNITQKNYTSQDDIIEKSLSKDKTNCYQSNSKNTTIIIETLKKLLYKYKSYKNL